jgi:hypothetical protein
MTDEQIQWTIVIGVALLFVVIGILSFFERPDTETNREDYDDE